MRVSRLHLNNFRRFTDFTISDVPQSARLVVLAGPNGVGKSSVFDAFRSWQAAWTGGNWDSTYHVKQDSRAPIADLGIRGHVQLEFHDWTPQDTSLIAKALYIRTANRMEADFSVTSVSVSAPDPMQPRINRTSDLDAAVSSNYQALITRAIAELFDDDRTKTTGDIQDALLGSVREAMARIFGDELLVENIGHPATGGAFYFSKGISRNWHYRNLSGGERAAFDLLLDLAAKREIFDDTIICIDEPEIHLNSRVQGLLLTELLTLLPGQCQLWVATHSLGMLTAAKTRAERQGDVIFLDFENRNFDEPTLMQPAVVDRTFWRRTLRVAIDDLVDLVAPARLVIVEGRPTWEGRRSGNVEFDARCLRRIFSRSMADTEFMSVGGNDVVENDRLQLESTTSVLAPGAKVIRLVDLDDRTPAQVEALKQEGVRTLSLRDLENYLLADEPLICLCDAADPTTLRITTTELLSERDRLLAALTTPAPDDYKAIAPDLYTWLRRNSGLRQLGNDTAAFLRDTMSGNVREGMGIYETLRRDIFG